MVLHAFISTSILLIYPVQREVIQDHSETVCGLRIEEKSADGKRCQRKKTREGSRN